MHKKVREMMNTHEKERPEERELNDKASEDLKSLGEISPSKPFAMHVGYTLDGHHNNRPHYGRNYDYGLLGEDKKQVDHELFEIAELGAMLHDPEYITDKSHDAPSKNQKMAHDILEHYLKKHGPQEGHAHLKEELYKPLLEALMDRSIDKKSILHELLSPAMVKNTPHSREEYSSLLKALLVWPVLKGHQKGHWKHKLPGIFESLGGGKDAKSI